MPYILTKYCRDSADAIVAEWPMPTKEGATWRLHALFTAGYYADLRCAISGRVLEHNMPAAQSLRNGDTQQCTR